MLRLRLLMLLLLRPRILRLRRAIRLRRAVGLLLLLLEILLALHRLRNLRRLAVIAAAFVRRTAGIVAGHLLLRRLRLIMRVLLPELFLRRGDQAKVVLGVLMMRFSGDMIAH